MGSRLGVEKKNTRKRQRENRTEVEKASREKRPKRCRGRGARVCLLELSARVFSFSLTFASSAFFNAKSFAAPPLRTATRKRQRGPFSPVRVCVCVSVRACTLAAAANTNRIGRSGKFSTLPIDGGVAELVFSDGFRAST